MYTNTSSSAVEMAERRRVRAGTKRTRVGNEKRDKEKGVGNKWRCKRWHRTELARDGAGGKGQISRERDKQRGEELTKVAWGERRQGERRERAKRKCHKMGKGALQPEARHKRMGEARKVRDRRGAGSKGDGEERAGWLRMAGLMSHSALPLPRRGGC